MIGYVTLGTKDLQKAAAFYDKIAAEMGIGRFMESDTFIAWGAAGRRRRHRLDQAFRRQTHDGRQRRDGRPGGPRTRPRSTASTSSRCRWAVPTRALPGRAAKADFYAAYFRDLDGNKLNAFVMG